MLDYIIEQYLPFIVSALELMGIIVITVGAFKAFYHYVKGLIFKKDYPIKHQFANSMATGLEFKLGAEILKTVLIRSLDEIVILGSIILLRALMTVIIQWEMKNDEKTKIAE